MKIVKDLLYTRGNQALDIARFSSLFSVLAFWGCVAVHTWTKGDFDALAVGGGCAAIMAGAGGWIYYRQKKEDEVGGA